MEVLEGKNFAQIGFVVKDIEATKKKFAALLGIEVPKTVDCGRYEVTRTSYEGKPAPEAMCLMAFFDLTEGVQLELIQPNEGLSTWRKFLDEHGEGIHHIAFNVKGMSEKISQLEALGMHLEQRGEYGSGDGRYAYLSAFEDYKCRFELLEDDNK